VLFSADDSAQPKGGATELFLTSLFNFAPRSDEPVHLWVSRTLDFRKDCSFLELSLEQKAEAFVLLAFISSATTALLEQRWVMTHHELPFSQDFELFVERLLANDLRPIAFLRELFLQAPVARLQRLNKTATQAVDALVQWAGELNSSADLKLFAKRSFVMIRDLVQLELARRPEHIRSHALFNGRMNTLQHDSADTLKWPATRPLPLESSLYHTMYRTFDGMDHVLGISYESDIGMRRPQGTEERLYEGAGLGVQSSFTTIIVALEALAPPPNASFIDLGSGYGRVGLVVGLLRPDIDFTGFEFVEHRVAVSIASTVRCGLSTHVHFKTQDLSAPDFKIPVADVYYLFDPFSRETYEHVFAQIVEIGSTRDVAVLTKGHAGTWFAEACAGKNWIVGKEFDEGTLRIFRAPSSEI
jgi:hypothetical protein